MLGRIREALREPAPLPAEHNPHEFREWLPSAGDSQEERIALFARLSEMLRTEFVECSDERAAAAHVAQLATDQAWKRISRHPGALCDAVAAHLPPALSLMSTDAGYAKDDLENCDAGLSECECLVAQTGSVCVTALSSGGRALSVLPPHHFVVARRSQLVADLTAAFDLLARKYAGKYPSFMTFITGPSRTGDIERILVLGAHGPRKLTVLLLP